VRVFLVDDSLTRDSDGDGLTDLAEERLLSDPGKSDTDGDGIGDGQDRDPLAASSPGSDEAAIRAAMFRHERRAPAEGTRAMAIVISPERQVYGDPATTVLSLRREESDAFAAKYSGNFYWFEYTIKVDRKLGTATASTSRGVPMAAYGATFTLEKRRGQWVVTGMSNSWVS